MNVEWNHQVCNVSVRTHYKKTCPCPLRTLTSLLNPWRYASLLQHTVISGHFQVLKALSQTIANYICEWRCILQPPGGIRCCCSSQAAADAQVPVTFRMQAGYDHSYYFISTFIGEHIAHHVTWPQEGIVVKCAL